MSFIRQNIKALGGAIATFIVLVLGSFVTGAYKTGSSVLDAPVNPKKLKHGEPVRASVEGQTVKATVLSVNRDAFGRGNIGIKISRKSDGKVFTLKPDNIIGNQESISPPQE